MLRKDKKMFLIFILVNISINFIFDFSVEAVIQIFECLSRLYFRVLFHLPFFILLRHLHCDIRIYLVFLVTMNGQMKYLKKPVYSHLPKVLKESIDFLKCCIFNKVIQFITCVLFFWICNPQMVDGQ